MISSDELRAAVPALEELPAAATERLATAAVERRFAKGATLFRAGDDAEGLYFILSGRVRVSRESQDRAHLLHGEGPGGVLGEIPVFGGGAFPATAVAIEPTRCAHVARSAVERLLREEPAFARFALRRIALRAHSLLRRIDELTATTITARVASHLLARAEGASTRFSLGMSQAELANELGTAREVIVRALGTLVEAGAIERVGRSEFSVARASVLRAMAAP